MIDKFSDSLIALWNVCDVSSQLITSELQDLLCASPCPAGLKNGSIRCKRSLSPWQTQQRQGRASLRCKHPPHACTHTKTNSTCMYMTLLYVQQNANWCARCQDFSEKPTLVHCGAKRCGGASGKSSHKNWTVAAEKVCCFGGKSYCTLRNLQLVVHIGY